MSIEIEGNAVRCTVDAALPGDALHEVTFRVTAANVEHVRASDFVARLCVIDEIRALRAALCEMADLVLEQRTEIEGLEAELEEAAS